jgi:hypothetical protein
MIRRYDIRIVGVQRIMLGFNEVAFTLVRVTVT